MRLGRREAGSLTPDPVCIVAAGAVTPLGGDLDSFWAGLLAGGDGISPIERFPVADLRVGRGGEIKKLPPVAAAITCRASALLVAAAADLVARRSLDAAPERIAVVVGTALGGVERLEQALAGSPGPRVAAGALYDAPAHALADWLGARGPVLTVSTACASSATALATGADLLDADAADLIVAGGYDALCRFVVRGFDVLRSLARDRPRPFDRRRSGLLLGEGAGLVLLARERDIRGPRLGRLLGHGTASDASHISAPHPDGRGLLAAVLAALETADVGVADLDLVSAHGTGTILNDRMEATVLGRVLGGRAVPVNSIKGALGHTMGAAAVLEAMMCLLAARDGLMPATVGLEEQDPGCALDLVAGAPRPVRARLALSTSAGFGGCNAALVLEGAA